MFWIILHLSASPCYSVRQNKLRQKNNDLFEHEIAVDSNRFRIKIDILLTAKNFAAVVLLLLPCSLAINITNKQNHLKLFVPKIIIEKFL